MFEVSILNLKRSNSEEGNPFQWHPVTVSGPWDLKKAAEVFKYAMEGDPDCDPSEDALGLLNGYLADPVLNKSLSCIQIGLINSVVAAIVIAQVNPTTRWSRITYMGLIPEYRRMQEWIYRF